jgi:hypothetical protein
MRGRPLFRSVVVVLAGYVAGAAWLWLDTALAHVAPLEKLGNRLLLAFLLPTTAATLLWLFHAFESRRPVCAHEPGDVAATERILLRIVVFICGLHSLVLLQLIEAPWIRRWGPDLLFVLIGALLVSVGNLLPTTRPNVLVGIRTRRSLRSRDFWIAINRVGGYLSVALGLVMIAAAAFLSYPVNRQATAVAVLAAIAILAERYHTLARASTAG